MYSMHYNGKQDQFVQPMVMPPPTVAGVPGGGMPGSPRMGGSPNNSFANHWNQSPNRGGGGQRPDGRIGSWDEWSALGKKGQMDYRRKHGDSPDWSIIGTGRGDMNEHRQRSRDQAFAGMFQGEVPNEIREWYQKKYGQMRPGMAFQAPDQWSLYNEIKKMFPDAEMQDITYDPLRGHRPVGPGAGTGAVVAPGQGGMPASQLRGMQRPGVY